MRLPTVVADFAGIIKGSPSPSMQDKIDGVLAVAKIAADADARGMRRTWPRSRRRPSGLRVPVRRPGTRSCTRRPTTSRPSCRRASRSARQPRKRGRGSARAARAAAKLKRPDRPKRRAWLPRRLPVRRNRRAASRPTGTGGTYPSALRRRALVAVPAQPAAPPARRRAGHAEVGHHLRAPGRHDDRCVRGRHAGHQACARRTPPSCTARATSGASARRCSSTSSRSMRRSESRWQHDPHRAIHRLRGRAHATGRPRW